MPAGLPHQNYDDGDSVFSVQISGEVTPRRMENRATLHVFADEIAPGDWSAHAAKIAKLDPHLGVSFTVPSVPRANLAPMMKELTTFDENVKLKKLSFKTKVQAESQVRTMILTYALDGGRLSPSLMAQALVIRGVAYGNLGQFGKAQADFDQALKLAPASKDTLAAASVNAAARRDYPRAIELATQSLAADPKDSEALYNRAKAYYLSQQFFPARQDLDELLKDRSWVRRGYPVLMWYLTALHIGSDGTEALSRFSSSDLPSEWPRPLIDAAAGKIDSDAALLSAKNTEPANEHLCEAFFYLGEKLYAFGEDKRAVIYFENSINQGTTEFFEDWASHNELFNISQKRQKALSK
jgi:lipoprotein NlpI